MKDHIKVIIGEKHERRGVAFLISDDKNIDAHRFYYGLPENNTIRRMFNTRFDNWQEGQPPKNHRYHGWDNSEFNGRYKKCFVFKYQENRLYGFLCNPKDGKPRYQICVLIVCATKHKKESDETYLKYVEKTREDFTVKRIIKDYFKEKI